MDNINGFILNGKYFLSSLKTDVLTNQYLHAKLSCVVHTSPVIQGHPAWSRHTETSYMQMVFTFLMEGYPDSEFSFSPQLNEQKEAFNCIHRGCLWDDIVFYNDQKQAYS